MPSQSSWLQPCLLAPSRQVSKAQLNIKLCAVHAVLLQSESPNSESPLTMHSAHVAQTNSFVTLIPVRLMEAQDVELDISKSEFADSDHASVCVQLDFDRPCISSSGGKSRHGHRGGCHAQMTTSREESSLQNQFQHEWESEFEMRSKPVGFRMWHLHNIVCHAFAHFWSARASEAPI